MVTAEAFCPLLFRNLGKSVHDQLNLESSGLNKAQHLPGLLKRLEHTPVYC